jgi:hypothetical protein
MQLYEYGRLHAISFTLTGRQYVERECDGTLRKQEPGTVRHYSSSEAINLINSVEHDCDGRSQLCKPQKCRNEAHDAVLPVDNV